MKVRSVTGLATILILLLPLTWCGRDCWWPWQLEPEDPCSKYQEASLECKTHFRVYGPMCTGCLKDRHMEILGIERGSPGPSSSTGEKVLDCFDRRVKRCEDEELEVVFANCVERITGIPTIDEE